MENKPQSFNRSMQHSGYPQYYNVLRNELLGFLPGEEAKDDFVNSLYLWLINV